VIPGAILVALNFPVIHWGKAAPLGLLLLTAMVYTRTPPTRSWAQASAT